MFASLLLILMPIFQMLFSDRLLDQDFDLPADVELTVSGRFYDETAFEGRDIISLNFHPI